jgi:hypothetical protein
MLGTVTPDANNKLYAFASTTNILEGQGDVCSSAVQGVLDELAKTVIDG